MCSVNFTLCPSWVFSLLLAPWPQTLPWFCPLKPTVLPLFSVLTSALCLSYIMIYVSLINDPWTACEAHFAPFYTDPAVTAWDFWWLCPSPAKCQITRHWQHVRATLGSLMNIRKSSVCCQHTPHLESAARTLRAPIAALLLAGAASPAGQTWPDKASRVSSVVSWGRWGRDQCCTHTDTLSQPAAPGWGLGTAFICILKWFLSAWKGTRTMGCDKGRGRGRGAKISVPLRPWIPVSSLRCPERLCGAAWLCLQGALPDLSPSLVHPSHPVFFWSGWSALRSTQSNHCYSRFESATEKAGIPFFFDNTFFRFT